MKVFHLFLMRKKKPYQYPIEKVFPNADTDKSETHNKVKVSDKFIKYVSMIKYRNCQCVRCCSERSGGNELYNPVIIKYTIGILVKYIATQMKS